MTEILPAGPAGSVDLPRPGTLVEGRDVEVCGWAMHAGAAVHAVRVTLSGPGYSETRLAEPCSRPDVAEFFGSSEEERGAFGWRTTFDCSALADGSTLVAQAIVWPTAGSPPTALPRCEFRVAPRSRLSTDQATGAVEGALDLPRSGTVVEGREVEVCGWAMHEGLPVLAVAVTLSGPGYRETRLAEACSRPDVAEFFGSSEEEGGAFGWRTTFDLSRIVDDAALVAQAIVWPTAASSQVALPACEFRAVPQSCLANDQSAAVIEGALDIEEGVALDPSQDLLRIQGWALRRGGSIDEVEVFVDGSSIGRARLGLYRPDVFDGFGVSEALLCGFEHYSDLGRSSASSGSVVVSAVVRADRESLQLKERVVPLVSRKHPEQDGKNRRARRLAAETSHILGLVPPGLVEKADGTDGKLNLLVVTHDLGYGGGQLWLQELLRRSGAGRDFPCGIISRAPGPLTEELEGLGITVHVRDEFTMRDAELYEAQMLELALWTRLHRHNAVLVNTMGAFVGADLAQRLGLPCAWAIHESWPPEEYWKLNFPSGFVDPAVMAIAHRVLATTPAVIFEAEATRRLYHGSVGNGAGVVIPYGIDLSDIDEYCANVSKHAARRLLELPDDVRLVLLLGTIEPRKAQTVLTQAFERVAAAHPDALLALVGDMQTPYSRALRRYVEDGPLADRVRIVPVIKDIYPWYRAADFFVSASDIESMPRSVLEAMAFGVPVLATEVFGLPELIEHGKSGWLFRARSVAAAALALDGVLRLDDGVLSAVGATGAHVVRDFHNSHGYVREIISLLRAMCEGTEINAADWIERLRVSPRSTGVGNELAPS